ncbi:MAG: hypothetical protein DI598_04135 [Pseudopedobacter saltans]|uniref:Uncharacterized protein n=1 Tax=Pseudopedobacter saltans TaxID=151895 RepID=A0A2W5FBM5_9SPHI|nr:MAG: hypothetical protein DI598_04135 [Pseudopedobacter saltans]
MRSIRAINVKINKINIMKKLYIIFILLTVSSLLPLVKVYSQTSKSSKRNFEDLSSFTKKINLSLIKSIADSNNLKDSSLLLGISVYVGSVGNVDSLSIINSSCITKEDMLRIKNGIMGRIALDTLPSIYKGKILFYKYFIYFCYVDGNLNRSNDYYSFKLSENDIDAFEEIDNNDHVIILPIINLRSIIMPEVK